MPMLTHLTLDARPSEDAPEPSMLAREAFKAGESVLSARRALAALRNGREQVDGAQLRFLSHFLSLSDSDQALLLETVPQ